MTVTFQVKPPVIAEDRVEYRIDVSGVSTTRKAITTRIKSLAKGWGSPRRFRIRFGFKSENFKVSTNPTWNIVYPITALTNLTLTGGGHFFDQEIPRCIVQSESPIPTTVADFFRARFALHGIDLEIDAKICGDSSGHTCAGHALAFGGGKDSRLLLGLQKEMGIDPDLYHSRLGRANETSGVQNVHISRALSGRLVDRLFPAIMSSPASISLGKGLGECQVTSPWHQYYEWSSHKALESFGSMLSSQGHHLRIDAPLTVLPYNLIQRILIRRYPELWKGQSSVGFNVKNEKNLHVALLLMNNGESPARTMAESTFKELLQRFCSSQLLSPHAFGLNGHREFINREMRALIYSSRDNPAMADVRHLIPSEWEGPWIDYIHHYAVPGLDSSYLEIFRQYADFIPDKLRREMGMRLG